MRGVRWGVAMICVGVFSFVLMDVGSERAVVVAVIDGDTVRIDTGETVRLLGIDAPEYGGGVLWRRAMCCENWFWGVL